MNSNFENDIRSRFEGFEADLSDQLFDRIQTKRKKRRVAMWWWTGLGGAAVIFTVAMLMLDRNTVPEGQQTLVKAPVEDILPSTTEQSQSTDVVVEEPIADNQVSSLPLADHPAPAGTVAPVIEQPDNQVDPVIAELPSADPHSGSTLEEQPVSAEEIATVEELPHEVVAQEVVPDPTEDELETEEIEPIEHIAENEQPEDDEIRGNKRRPSRWSLDVQVAPGYASRFYSGDEAAMQWRRSVETPSLSFLTSIGVSYKISPKWRLQTGVQYFMRNEIMSFNHLQNGVLVEEGGRNHYTRLAIPLTLEHDLYQRNGYGIHVMGGAHFGVHQTQDGIARVGEHETVLLQDQTIDRSGSVAALLGLGLNVQLNKRTQFVLRPQLSYDLNETSTGTLGLNRREFGVHTNLGIRYAW